MASSLCYKIEETSSYFTENSHSMCHSKSTSRGMPPALAFFWSKSWSKVQNFVEFVIQIVKLNWVVKLNNNCCWTDSKIQALFKFQNIFESFWHFLRKPFLMKKFHTLTFRELTEEPLVIDWDLCNRGSPVSFTSSFLVATVSGSSSASVVSVRYSLKNFAKSPSLCSSSWYDPTSETVPLSNTTIKSVWGTNLIPWVTARKTTNVRNIVIHVRILIKKILPIILIRILDSHQWEDVNFACLLFVNCLTR